MKKTYISQGLDTLEPLWCRNTPHLVKFSSLLHRNLVNEFY